jgi:hypothetical protein
MKHKRPSEKRALPYLACLWLALPAAPHTALAQEEPAGTGEATGPEEAVEDQAETGPPAEAETAAGPVKAEEPPVKAAAKAEADKEKEGKEVKKEKKAKWKDGQGPEPAPEPKTLLPPTGFSFNHPKNPVKFYGAVELGFIGVLKHRIQFSKTGTEFNYVKEGGQDVLFFFARLSAELRILKRHAIIFLYQPINIETQAVAGRDIVVDELTFPEGTPLDLRYGFDFYRLSYLYDFFKDPDVELAIGLSMQIRVAAISFTSADGLLRRARDDIGPVPVIKLRARYTFKPGIWLGFEADGFWASGRIITGSNNDFEGAILDMSLRLGFNLTRFLETFVNVRYLGGGARGTDKDFEGPGDGYTNNWLHTMSLSLGFGFK